MTASFDCRAVQSVAIAIINNVDVIMVNVHEFALVGNNLLIASQQEHVGVCVGRRKSLSDHTMPLYKR